jgi:hypothetical protein
MTLLIAFIILVFLGLLLRADRVVYYPYEDEQPRWHCAEEELARLNPLRHVTTHVSQDRRGKWFFWDECQAGACGPFPSKREAERGLQRYADSLYPREAWRSRLISHLHVKHSSWFSSGVTRVVFMTRENVYKFPTFESWRNFLNGLLANMQERRLSATGWPELCPVKFALPGGLLVVMPRALPVSDHEWEVFDYERYVDRESYTIPVENKRSSFGVLRGRLVAIDYGS